MARVAREGLMRTAMVKVRIGFDTGVTLEQFLYSIWKRNQKRWTREAS
jgi:hypothetical protein